MASAEKFDLVILGSGSTAFAASLRAQELGSCLPSPSNPTCSASGVSGSCCVYASVTRQLPSVHGN